jgi:hypothetical protein
VDVQFTGRADFEGARVNSAAEPDGAWPPGWTTRPDPLSQTTGKTRLHVPDQSGGRQPTRYMIRSVSQRVRRAGGKSGTAERRRSTP